MREYSKKKLLKLAKFLETKVRAKRFSLDSWADFWFDADDTDMDCGSTACALGWATKCFPKQGLKIDTVPYSLGSTQCVYYKDCSGFAAGAKFFGISHAQSQFLFESAFYPSWGDTRKIDVIRRIRNLVENDGAMPKDEDKWRRKVTFTKQSIASMNRKVCT